MIVIWVDSGLGADADGDGSSGRPLRTLERALEVAWGRWHADRLEQTVMLRMGTYSAGPHDWPYGTKVLPAVGLHTWSAGPDQIIVSPDAPAQAPHLSRLINFVEAVRLRLQR